jgi:hypothetical protein
MQDGLKIGCRPSVIPAAMRWRPAVNFKNVLLAATAAVALLGAAVIAVPSSGDRPLGEKLFHAAKPR